MVKTKLFIIFCWFQYLAHANKAMNNDVKGFDGLIKCLCNNNDAAIKDLAEHCTTEKEMNGHCLCNLTGTEPKDSIFKNCLSLKKTFCSGYKMINQGGHCNTSLCMAALLKCKDSENSGTTTNYDQTTTDEYRDSKNIQEYLCQGETLNISCQNNFVIVFEDANFGREKSDRNRCRQWTGTEMLPCDHHKQTLKFLNKKCKGQKCFLPVNKDTFGTPCRGITKYLYVEYYCKRNVNHGSKNTTYDGRENDGRDNRKGSRDRKDRKNRKKNSRNSNTTTDSDQTAVDENRLDKKDRRKKKAFQMGAIVGISVGVTCTLVLFLIILAIYVCRRRAKKNKRKQQTRLQAVDQRFEMAHLESGPSCSNKEQYNIPFTNKPLNTDEAQGEYFVLDPSFTKYDKDLSNRKLPEIKRCSGADGDDNVYYEIDEDNIKSSSDMDGVHQKKVEVRDHDSHPSDLTINQTQIGSTEKNTEQLTRQQSVDQEYEMSNFEISHSSANQEGNTILSENNFVKPDEAQGEYFVLDPSVTKYDKDMVIPEVNITSVAQEAETVYNEIDEDPIESSTVIKVDLQKQMKEASDIAIYHSDLTNHESKLGFDNATYNVTSEVDDIIF
ncbi:uncharacterized protein LOC134726856 [Mytilus trossulus]|uniref:uncharacterized protein LOC134726856 n=1 Tax=Mytilus trossulus TaxID=6551 RepID=UPI003005E9CD